MNTTLKKYFFILIILTSITFGCSPSMIIGPIVTGVTYWIQGESHRYYSENKEIIYKATKHVLETNNLKINKEYVKNNIYYINAGTYNRFKIKIESFEKVTKLNIRINTFGDKDYTELLYKQIDKESNIIYYNNGKPVINL